MFLCKWHYFKLLFSADFLRLLELMTFSVHVRRNKKTETIKYIEKCTLFWKEKKKHSIFLKKLANDVNFWRLSVPVKIRWGGLILKFQTKIPIFCCICEFSRYNCASLIYCFHYTCCRFRCRTTKRGVGTLESRNIWIYTFQIKKYFLHNFKRVF